jgi:hypothetical protein
VVHPSYGEEKEFDQKKKKKKKKKRKEKEKRSLHDKCPRACEKQL